MNTTLEELGKIGIVPVIKIDDAAKAVPLAKALEAGGIPCAEVTFRTAAGEAAIKEITKNCPAVLAGAGTVLSTEQVDRAIAAGAKFIVSPGYNPKVVEYCLAKGIPVTPGCATPSDMEAALEAGLDVVKFFPAEQAGGLPYLKAVSAPYSKLKFMPTGGINAENLPKYLAFDKILACGGSWMVKGELIEAGNFEGITALCRQAVFASHGFKFFHIGINGGNEEAAKKTALRLEALFGFAVRKTDISYFSGDDFEVMNTAGLGKMGHIGIAVNNMARAQAYLERMGVKFLPETARRDAAGKVTFIYLEEEFSGFAVHLSQKK